MHVQMKDLLMPVRTTVDNEPVAILRNALLFSYLFSHDEHVTEHGFIVGGHIIDGGNKLVGDNQDMDWGLRTNISKRRDLLILKNNIGRYFSADNFAKNGFFGHKFFSLSDKNPGFSSKSQSIWLENLLSPVLDGLSKNLVSFLAMWPNITTVV
jgi:hypothetical protein